MCWQISFHPAGEQATAEPNNSGSGICSYTASSAVDIHVEGDTTSTYRAMLLSDVVVGEAFKMAAEDETPAEVKLRISI